MSSAELQPQSQLEPQPIAQLEPEPHGEQKNAPVFDNASTPKPQSTQDILQKLRPAGTTFENPAMQFTTPTKEHIA